MDFANDSFLWENNHEKIVVVDILQIYFFTHKVFRYLIYDAVRILYLNGSRHLAPSDIL